MEKFTFKSKAVGSVEVSILSDFKQGNSQQNKLILYLPDEEKTYEIEFLGEVELFEFMNGINKIWSAIEARKEYESKKNFLQITN